MMMKYIFHSLKITIIVFNIDFRLLHWIQSKVNDLPIGNFTTDWNDGKAVGALVDSVAPGLCPDWEDWDPKNSLNNATEAMNLADDWLNVRQVNYYIQY